MPGEKRRVQPGLPAPATALSWREDSRAWRTAGYLCCDRRSPTQFQQFIAKTLKTPTEPATTPCYLPTRRRQKRRLRSRPDSAWRG